MYTIAIVLFAAFALVFLTSCVLYFMGKRTLLRFVMQWATIVLLALVALLLLVLIGKDIPLFLSDVKSYF
jgi:predicted PurR-regulated permease PerM